MPTNVNGRSLGVARNGIFTSANTDAIVGGRLWPEAAATWTLMRAAFIADGGAHDHFQPGGPASSARSIAQQEFFWRNQPPPAARPSTSNHGWGIAVDIPYADAQAWLMRNGRTGMAGANDEGRRVGERWHMGYVGAPKALLRRLKRDPLASYTASEKRWIKEYDTLRRAGRDIDRRRVLRRVMTQQRKRIWRLAQATHNGGWTRSRRRRYASLKARTT